MTLRIWGRENSINVQKVLWCCDELGLGYVRLDAGGPFGLPEDYRSMNPNNRVPTISDDGFVLWESNAIVRYLCSEYGPGILYSEDLRRRADADRWMDWQATTLWPAMHPVFWGLVRTPPEDRNEVAIEEGRRKSVEAWGILQAHLEGRDYALGDTFTMADIPLGVSIYRWLQLPVERPSMPDLEAYHWRLAERPAFRERVMLPLT